MPNSPVQNNKPSQDPDFPDKRMRCLRCKFEWVSPTGATSCRKCPHQYVVWVNHLSWQATLDNLEDGEVTDIYEE